MTSRLDRRLGWGLLATLALCGVAAVLPSEAPGDAGVVAPPALAATARGPAAAAGLAEAAGAAEAAEAGGRAEPLAAAAPALEGGPVLRLQAETPPAGPAAPPLPAAERTLWPAPAPEALRAWSPPKPAAQPAPPPEAPRAPPAPPSFAYQWIGQLQDASGLRFYLGGPRTTLAVRAGDTVDRQWRVEGVQEGRLKLTWLATGATVEVTLR